MNIADIGVLATSLKTAGDLVATMVGLRDSSKIQDAARELNTVILAAQGSALEAQRDQFALLKQVDALEKEIAAIKNWEAEKQRYQLQPFGGRGGLAYVVKKEARGTEAPHAICTNCYEQGRKSILQFNGVMNVYQQTFDCPNCGANVAASQRSVAEQFAAI